MYVCTCILTHIHEHMCTCVRTYVRMCVPLAFLTAVQHPSCHSSHICKSSVASLCVCSFSALHHCAANGYSDLVKEIVEYGGIVMVGDNKGESVLISANMPP